MNEMKAALHALLNNTKLSAAEIASLTLGDLHLSDKEPSLTVWSESTGQRRRIQLDSRTRDRIVNWMLLRPDRPITLLFPNEEDEEYSPAELQALASEHTPSQADLPPKPVGGPERSFAPPRFAVSAPPPPSSPERLAPPEQLVPDDPVEAPAPDAETSAATPPPGLGSESQIDSPTSSTEPKSSAEPEPEPEAEAEAEPKAPPARLKDRLPAGRWGLGAGVAAVVLLLLCGGLFVGGSFLFFQSDNNPLISAVDTPTTPDSEATLETVPEDSPASTDTPAPELAPSDTPTPESTATETPAPTDTPTPEPAPSDTPTPEATATETPAPTDTPTPEPTATETNTPAPPPTEAPAEEANDTGDEEAEDSPPPAPEFVYSAPTLLAPTDDTDFIPGNTVELFWEPVGELADNQRYAVRVVFRSEGETRYEGTQLQETQWIVPERLRQLVDGPEFEFNWFVYVEQVQSDGTGVAISPESEWRSLAWPR